MAAHFADFKACARSAKPTDAAHPAEQRVALAFDVGEDGRIARTGESSGALVQCLDQTLASVTFAPGAADVAHVVYPLYFAAAGAELTSARVTPNRPAKACDCGG